MRSLRWLFHRRLALLAGAVGLLAAGPARANVLQAVCTTKTDCPGGFTCETFSTSEDCDSGTCRSIDVKICKSPMCTRDSDCPTNMVCYTESPDGGCPSGALAACGSPTVACVPRYARPCRRDSDCGPSFTCEQAFCMLQWLACSAAANCPSAFTCQDNPLAACDSGASAFDAGPRKVCLPPYQEWYYGFGCGGASVGVTNGSGPTDAGNTQTATTVKRNTKSAGCEAAAFDAADGGRLSLLATLALAFAVSLSRRRRLAPGRGGGTEIAG